MPQPDATAIAALEGPALSVAYYIYANIDTGLRFTTFGSETIISGSGDAELDGTYPAFGGQLLEVGDVNNSDGGSDTLVLRLSGITSIDSDLINDIGDRTKWQGRIFRIWFRCYDESGVSPQGAIVPLYTGYMSTVRITGEPKMQAIEIGIENWLAAFSQASNRSYLNQKDYDAADISAEATIAAANGMRRDTGATGPIGGGGFGGFTGGGTGGGGIGSAYGGFGGSGSTQQLVNSV